MTHEINPYESPSKATSSVSKWSPAWRLIPAIVAALIGFGFITLGVGAIVLIATLTPTAALWLLIVACALYFGVGALWLYGSWSILKMRYRLASVCVILGLVIPLVVLRMVTDSH